MSSALGGDDWLPNIVDLHLYGDLEQTQLLDYLFEPSPAIHDTLIPIILTAQYSSYPELIDACQIRLLSLAASASRSSSANSSSFNTATKSLPPTTAGSTSSSKAAQYGTYQTLLATLGSHPRLGEKKIESAQSAAEQANLLGNDSSGHAATDREAEELARLNREYEKAFPGLRYVVFVNGRDRDDILDDMRRRITRADFDKEVISALAAICDIAKDRAAKTPMRDIVYRPPTEDITVQPDSFVSYRH